MSNLHGVKLPLYTPKSLVDLLFKVVPPNLENPTREGVGVGLFSLHVWKRGPGVLHNRHSLAAASRSFKYKWVF